MIKVGEQNVQRLVNDVILQLDPMMVEEEAPGIATHVLFMCLMYADHLRNAKMIQGILTRTMSGIKDVVMHNTTDMNMLAFWTSNTYRLLSNMKQFSGEKQFKVHGSLPQRNFRNFDLQQYRTVLADLLVQIYRTVVKHIEHQLTPLIVPGILEHESIPGMGAPTNSSPKRRSSQKRSVSVQTIIELLNTVHRHLTRQCVEPTLIKQIYTQVFYGINVLLVNSMLLRKDFCHWTKGMQVRYNLTKLEEWARDSGMDESNAALLQAIQISQLLQVNKNSLDDVDLIYATCGSLNALQMQKILTMYAPAENEERVPANVIRAVVERGADNISASQLMMDDNFMFPVKFPFEPCAPDFASVKLPVQLRLDKYLEIV